MRARLERISRKQNESFSVFHYFQPRFTCPYHYHPEVELTWILAGHGQRLIGDHLGNFETGDLVLMGSELPHSYFNPPGFRQGPKGAGSMVLQFRPDCAGGVLKEAPECQRVRLLLQRASRGLAFKGTVRTKVQTLLEGLARAKNSRRILLLLEILEILASDRKADVLASPGFRPEFNQAQGTRIEKACTWITERFREPITLVQAARAAHMSPPAFSRFFHRATNRTFVYFVNELRIGHACRALLETDRGVAEIAYDCGYENLSNFNRRFRELRNMTPVDYRKSALV